MDGVFVARGEGTWWRWMVISPSVGGHKTRDMGVFVIEGSIGCAEGSYTGRVKTFKMNARRTGPSCTR